MCIYKKPGFGLESCCSYIIEYSLLYKNKSNWYKQKYIVEHNNQIVSHTHTILTWRNSEVTRITVIQNLILLFLICIQYSNYQLFLNNFISILVLSCENNEQSPGPKVSGIHLLTLKSEQHLYLWLFKSLIVGGHGNLLLVWDYLIMTSIFRSLDWDQWQHNRYWSSRSYRGTLSKN